MKTTTYMIWDCHLEEDIGVIEIILEKMAVGLIFSAAIVGASSEAVAQSAAEYEVVIFKRLPFFGYFDSPISFSDLDRIPMVSLHIASEDVPDALKAPIDIERQQDLCGPFYSPIGYIKRDQYRIYFSNSGRLCLGWMELAKDIDESEVERWNQLLIDTRREVLR